MSNPSDPAAVNSYAGGSRAPRLPRWTRQEILVLIEGKRVVESRGRGRIGGGRAAAAAAALVGAAPLEPKWAAVAAYCRRHGVDRGAVQCRKRWSNLAGDYKKIKEWEHGKGRGGAESFWAMRNDLRREQRLPGFFDREVYDILDGAAVVEVTAAAEERREKGEGSGPPAVPAAPLLAAPSEEEAVFDSGRTAAEDGLFSDFDDEKEAAAEEEDEEDEERTPPVTPAASAEVTVATMTPVLTAASTTVRLVAAMTPVMPTASAAVKPVAAAMPTASAAVSPVTAAEVTVAAMNPVMPAASAAVRPVAMRPVAMPVPAAAAVSGSEKRSEQIQQEPSNHPGSEKRSEQIQHEPSNHPGMAKDKHPADTPAKDSQSEKGSPSGEGHKRRRTSEEEAGDATLQSQLIEVLDRNSKVLASHLEAQNMNYQLDREQRKDHGDSLLGVLGKLADAIGRIADKL